MARGKWAGPGRTPPAAATAAAGPQRVRAAPPPPPAWLHPPLHPASAPGASASSLLSPASLAGMTPRSASNSFLPFSLSSLPLSLRTHALRLPGLATAPRGSVLRLSGLSRPWPVLLVPHLLTTPGLVRDFPAALDLKIYSSIPSASHYPESHRVPFVSLLWLWLGVPVVHAWDSAEGTGRQQARAGCDFILLLLDLAWSGL